MALLFELSVMMTPMFGIFPDRYSNPGPHVASGHWMADGRGTELFLFFLVNLNVNSYMPSECRRPHNWPLQTQKQEILVASARIVLVRTEEWIDP